MILSSLACICQFVRNSWCFCSLVPVGTKVSRISFQRHGQTVLLDINLKPDLKWDVKEKEQSSGETERKAEISCGVYNHPATRLLQRGKEGESYWQVLNILLIYVFSPLKALHGNCTWLSLGYPPSGQLLTLMNSWK